MAVNFKFFPGSPLLEANFEMLSKDNINDKFGLVAMVDAIGVKSTSPKKAKELIISLDALKKQIEQIIIPFLKSIIKSYSDKITNFQVAEPELFFFQDTFIVSLNTYNNENAKIILHSFCDSIAQLIVLGMYNGIFLRGAISIGDYIEYKNMIFGEALIDAADYYEDHDWFGLVATANLAKVLNDLYYTYQSNESDKIYMFEKLFSKYPVPSKKNPPSVKLWIINWPMKLSVTGPPFEFDMNQDIITYYYRIIEKSDHFISKEGRTKFENTSDYVEKYFSKNPELNTFVTKNTINFLRNLELTNDEKTAFINYLHIVNENLKIDLSIPDREITKDDYRCLKQLINIIANGFICSKCVEINVFMKRDQVVGLIKQYSPNEPFCIINKTDGVIKCLDIELNIPQLYNVLHPVYYNNDEYNNIKTKLQETDSNDIQLSLLPGKDAIYYKFFDNFIKTHGIESEDDSDKFVTFIKEHKKVLKKNGILPFEDQ